MKTQDIFLVFTTVFVNGVISQDNGTTTTDPGVTDVSKAFISLSVLGAACVAAFVIAKVVDHCYDRAALRDDASDISEHTRQLIRARIALSRFKRPIKDKTRKKKKSKKESEKNTKLFFKLWSNNAKTKSARRKLDVINVEEANIEDQIHMNGSVKKSSAHVTFIDDVDKRGSDSDGTVLTIAVPTLNPSNHVSSNGGSKDSPRTTVKRQVEVEKKTEIGKVATISGQVAKRENTGRNSWNEDTGKITHVKDNSGLASPMSGNLSVRTSTRRNTPVNGTRKPASITGTTITDRTSIKERRSVSDKGLASDIPRSSSTSSTKNIAKLQSFAQNKPGTPQTPKPISKVVSVKSALIKTPVTANSNSKTRATSAKTPSSSPDGRKNTGNTRHTTSVSVALPVVTNCDGGK